MGKKLVIAEKPSVALTIAKALGADEKKNGWYENDRYMVSWCYGHMLQIQDDPANKKWELEGLPIIPEEWRYEAIPDSREQLDKLISLTRRKDVDSLVCATDAGREGELIFRLVYNASGSKKPVERLWISSLEEASIKEGFEHLRDSHDYDRIYESALARSHADWVVGVNATRLYTLGYSSDGGQMSVGRVQTPTLNMIVERQREIDEFKVTKQWAVVKDFGTWKLETGKFRTEAEAEECLRKTGGKPTEIMTIEKAKKKTNPPLLYSLTTLQQDANRIFGMSAQETLSTMQALYEKKVLSYPRTDSNYITSDMEKTFTQIAYKLAEVFCPGLKPQGIKRLVNDDKVSDHYAIIVNRQFLKDMSLEEFRPDEKKILLLVVTRVLASVSAPYEYEETKVKGDTEGFEFAGTGKRELSEGWRGTERSMMRREAKEGMIFPSDIEEGKTYTAEKTELAKRDTQPPKPDTENTLLGAMDKAGSEDMPEDAERKGIGTSATRAGIIERLINVGYIRRQKAKSVSYLIPTEKGKKLIEIVSPRLKDVKTTADWEWRLKAIEKGNDSAESFADDIAREVTELVEKNREGLPARNSSSSGNLIGKCPVCGSPVMDKGRFVKCTNDKCGRSLWKENKRLNGHTITEQELKKLFHGETVEMTLLSARTGKRYQQLISIGKDEMNERYYSVDFRGFPEKKGGGKGKWNRTKASRPEKSDEDSEPF